MKDKVELVISGIMLVSMVRTQMLRSHWLMIHYFRLRWVLMVKDNLMKQNWYQNLFTKILNLRLLKGLRLSKELVLFREISKDYINKNIQIRWQMGV